MDIKYNSKKLFIGKIGCIEICIKSTYDMMVKIIQTLNEKYADVILAKPNAFMNDFYDAIFVYQQTKKLNADKTADLFINIIKTADDTFTSLQFDKDYDMIEIFTKVNNNIESEYYTTGIIKR